MSSDPVRRFLVTGPVSNRMRFHLQACLHLNAIEQRGDTVAYTCFAADAPLAFQVAADADVTVQEIVFVEDRETYPVVQAASHGMVWSRGDGRRP